MSEENIHVDTLVTEDMNKDELYDYAKYLEYRKEELLNINHSLQQKVEQLENIRKEAIKLIEEDILGKKIENVNWDCDECDYSDMPVERIKPLLNILNKGE